MHAVLFSVAVAASGPDLDVVAKAQRAAGTQLSSDTTLAKAAACLAKFARKGQALSAGLVRFCADATGVYESVLVPLVGETNASLGLLDALSQFFKNEAKARGLTHYGAANARGEESQTIAVLASMRRGTFEVQAADLCKQKRAAFSGEVAPGHSQPKAFLTLPGGTTETLALALKGRAFSGEASFRASGRYQLEIVGETAEGPHVVANRALFVCMRPPDAPPKELLSTTAPEPRRVLELINADRRRAGLAALTLDAKISAVAQAHAQDMQAHGYFAHNSRDGSTLGDRLKRARLGFLRATENLSSAPSAEDAHASLMGSPGHRKNILDPEVSTLGVGIVSQPLSNGSANYLFVTDFVARTEAQDPASFRVSLLTVLNQERAANRLQPIKLDPALSALAEKNSRAMAGRDSLGYVPDESRFFSDVRALKGEVEAEGDLFLTNDPSALRKSQHAKKQARAVGIGVAPASSKRHAEDVFWVSVVYVR